MSNKIPTKWSEEILDASFETLWDVFNTFVESDDKVMEQVKYGIRVKIPIHKIIDEEFECFPRKRKIRVLGYGTFNEDDFKDEKDSRKKLMLRTIAEQMDDDPTKPRGEIK